MSIEEILKLKPEEAWEALSVKPERKVDIEEIQKQLDPNQHDVMDPTVRPLKTVKKMKGKNSKGEPIYEDSFEEVNRIAIPFQQLIVGRRVGFVLGNPVKLRFNADDDAEKQLEDMVKRVWDKNKLTYLNRELARTLYSETEVAELWYLTLDKNFWSEEGVELRPRVKLLKPSEGNTLIPHWNDHDDMVAFSRLYSVTVGEDEVEVLETYTSEKIVTFKKTDEGVTVEEQKNPFGKIPIVYYSQDYPDWQLVQVMIERFETLLSNFGDTNDYFGSPMIAAYGKILSLSEKGQQGKVVQVEKDGKIEYLSWQHAPDSVKLEIETLLELIHTMTQTPNISFSQMKGLGNLSGIALKLMFMDAHMSVENKIEVLGEMFQRRLNLIKSVCGTVVNVKLESAVRTLDVEPIFKPYMPRNEKEEAEILSTATGGKPVLSVTTAVRNNSMVPDPEMELENLSNEAKADLEFRQKELAGSFEFGS